MKKIQKILLIVLIMVLCTACMGAYLPSEDTENTYQPFTEQDVLHEIAELARSIGLAENDPIITRAQELWWKAYNQFCADRDTIATVVYNEAWGGCSERHRELVAAVVINRVNSDRFPDSVYDVVTQPKQYHSDYADPNSFYGQRARADSEAWAVCQEIASRALRGEIDCDSNVLFQAEFVQGTGIYETHCTSYSTTYFCFG